MASRSHRRHQINTSRDGLYAAADQDRLNWIENQKREWVKENPKQPIWEAFRAAHRLLFASRKGRRFRPIS